MTTAAEGVVLIDKPSGPTSHDVVAMMRKALGTRKVGHAGTLDPMASGMLVLGVGRATRLLGHLAASDKEYVATVRLGAATDTDDAQGSITSRTDADLVTDDEIMQAARAFRGTILQRPSSVSAIKVDGKRAYARARAGEEVELKHREVTIHDLEVLSITPVPAEHAIDVTIRVRCSAGTYIRALARDLGAALQVGGHVTSLRRTRSGVFTHMAPLEQALASPQLMSIDDAVATCFATVKLDEIHAVKARHGVRVEAPHECPSVGLVGVMDPRGSVISLAEVTDHVLVPHVVFANG